MSSSIKLKNANGKTVSVTNSNANQTDKEIIYLNTVDELANASGSINAVVIVSDLSRGGTFEWSATGTANGGTVFAGVSGYWNRQYSGAVNVKWFGANEGMDNTIAIQKALDTGEDVYIDISSSTISASLIIGSQRLYNLGKNGTNRTQAIFNITGNFPAIINLGGYISFEIEGIYFNYGTSTPTDENTSGNKIAIYITGTGSGEFYHINNCTVRGAWIGYKDTTGSYLSKLTQVACRFTRQGFWKSGGTTIEFNTCSSSDGINGFIVESVLSSTLINCAADGLTVNSNSYGHTGNYFRYVYGLNIIGWDGESNSITNTATVVDNQIITSYMRFKNTVGSVAGVVGHSNTLNSSLANSGVCFFFVSDNSLIDFRACDLQKEGFSNDLVFNGSLSPVYTVVGINSSRTTINNCDFKAPTGGTPTVRYSAAGILSATLSIVNSEYDNTTTGISYRTSGGTFSADTMGFSSFTAGASFGTKTAIGSGETYGAFGGELATFQKNGNTALFSTTSSTGSGNCIITSRGTDGTAIAMFNNGVRVGHIDVSGSSTSYVTSSDYRLKDDIKDMSNFIERVKALKPVNFTWKLDGKKTDGFIAHELQEIIPEAVSGEKDKVDDNGNPDYQGIDLSKIVPLLTRTIQDLIHRIELLELK